MLIKYIKSLFAPKIPVIKNNTFLLWEPCSKSHSEVLPGYAKYLLDLGYHVSVLCVPERIKEGLFSRFNNRNLSINYLSKKQIRQYFLNNDLADIKGVLVTTVGKLCDSVHYEDIYKSFSNDADRSKLFFVEHEVSNSINAGTWREDFITLRKINYKNAGSVVVNPHYFGDVRITPKNKDITNFVTIGAIRNKRKDNNMIVDSAYALIKKGFKNFKITVIGKGHIKDLPKELHPYFHIKGRLSFDKMYKEIENADFVLTAYDENNPSHIRYNTSGTSGSFQLVYGFLKPCIITEAFAKINGFNNENAILYKNKDNYTDAFERAINLSTIEYASMQQNLKIYVDTLYNESLLNLKNLINKTAGEEQ